MFEWFLTSKTGKSRWILCLWLAICMYKVHERQHGRYFWSCLWRSVYFYCCFLHIYKMLIVYSTTKQYRFEISICMYACCLDFKNNAFIIYSKETFNEVRVFVCAYIISLHRNLLLEYKMLTGHSRTALTATKSQWSWNGFYTKSSACVAISLINVYHYVRSACINKTAKTCRVFNCLSLK